MTRQVHEDEGSCVSHRPLRTSCDLRGASSLLSTLYPLAMPVFLQLFLKSSGLETSENEYLREEDISFGTLKAWRLVRVFERSFQTPKFS